MLWKCYNSIKWSYYKTDIACYADRAGTPDSISSIGSASNRPQPGVPVQPETPAGQGMSSLLCVQCWM